MTPKHEDVNGIDVASTFDCEWQLLRSENVQHSQTHAAILDIALSVVALTRFR